MPTHHPLIGHTPLMRLANLEKTLNLPHVIYAKAEQFNPYGSVKDRTALYLLSALPHSRQNLPIQIVCATSGNTGIALSALASQRKYEAHIVMPENASQERMHLIRAYGGHLHLTKAQRGMKGAQEKALTLCQGLPRAVLMDQFTMPENVQAHYETTGPEISSALPTSCDCFIAGVGTGGTFTGTARYLKEQNPHLHAIAVEPAASPVLSGGKAGTHHLHGIGAGFLPPLFDQQLCDQIIPVEETEAQNAALLLLQTEQLFVGPSSGAALHAAIQFAKAHHAAPQTIAVLFPDSGERYLSTGWPFSK